MNTLKLSDEEYVTLCAIFLPSHLLVF